MEVLQDVKNVIYLPWSEGKWSNLHIGVCESFFPLVYKDRFLRPRVPNKYLAGKEHKQQQRK